MKEVILFLTLLPFNHRPEIKIEKARFPDRQSCLNTIHEYGFFEKKKYLFRDSGYMNETKTFGKKIREYYYSVLRTGYYECSEVSKPPENLRSEKITH